MVKFDNNLVRIWQKTGQIWRESEKIGFFRTGRTRDFRLCSVLPSTRGKCEGVAIGMDSAKGRSYQKEVCSV